MGNNALWGALCLLTIYVIFFNRLNSSDADNSRKMFAPIYIRLPLLFALLALTRFASAGDFPWSGTDLQGVPCHGISAGYGPYDYNDPELQKRRPHSPLWMVEIAHYTKHVQLLMDGADPVDHTMNSDNLDYTLRAFPNHHRALWTMIQWYIKHGRPKSAQSPVPPPECWLQRAIAFRPKDAVDYMLYGIYLHLSGLQERSLDYYKKAIGLDPTLAEAHYNYGLALVDRKKYQEARNEARLAYKLGYPLPGLRDRLRRAGYTLAEDRTTVVKEPK